MIILLYQNKLLFVVIFRKLPRFKLGMFTFKKMAWHSNEIILSSVFVKIMSEPLLI